jgi:hypothetical protein
LLENMRMMSASLEMRVINPPVCISSSLVNDSDWIRLKRSLRMSNAIPCDSRARKTPWPSVASALHSAAPSIMNVPCQTAAMLRPRMPWSITSCSVRGITSSADTIRTTVSRPSDADQG